MPSPPADPAPPAAESSLRAAALGRLRQGVNPFATQVAAVGTADEVLAGAAPEFAAAQLAELVEIIGTYRGGRPPTRAFAVLGERGAGKTHLVYALREDLRCQAADRGDETLLVVVERLAPGMDAVDYLLWQVANHFLAHKGEGGRLLGVVAGRLTARLLGEALRQLAPHQKADLVPAAGGLISRLGLGGGARVQARIDAVEAVVRQCEAKHPTPTQLRAALDDARVPPDAAVGVVERHLDRTESSDVVGWFRKALYGRLVRLALLDDRGPFEELHTGDFEDAPANVRNAGNLGRRLLETWLELLSILSIPVVVVFDQLEDYVTAPDPEQERLNSKFFTDSATRFINELRSVCLLVFANETFWIRLLNSAEPFARERLTQPFALPGRPARPHLLMPDRVPEELVERLTQRRLRQHYPDLDLTGLPPAFPFDAADVQRFANERSIRECLRKMSRRYDEIVHRPAPPATAPRPGWPPPPPVVPPPPPEPLRDRLGRLWKEHVAAAGRRFEAEGVAVNAALIPEVQNALDGWLRALHQHGLTGSGPWHKIDLVTDTKKRQYGYLCVVRTDGKNAPGVGIAAWFGQRRGLPQDLRERVEFFDANPCPVKTLVMLRAEGEAVLSGPETKKVYDAACKAGRDVRVHPYEPGHLHALLAFGPWLQAATAEVEAAKDTGPDPAASLRDQLGAVSKELLGWVDGWRQPRPAADLFSAAATGKGTKA